MEKLVVALLCMLCAATCSAHRRHPHVQPLLRGPFPYCQPCPTPFTPPPPPPPQREQNLAQCPCVKPPGSKECATYDRRMQAATLEEALYSFPDLGKRASAGKAKPLFDASKEVQSLGESVQTEKVAPMAAGLGGPATLPMARFFGAAAPELDVAQTTQAPLSAAVASIALPAGEYSCNSPACKACLLSVVNGFIESGKNSADQATLAQFLSMQKQLEVESRGAQCPGLTPATAGFNVMASEAAPAAAKMAMASPPLPVPQEVITQIVKAIQPDGAAVKRRSTTDEEERTHEEAVAAEESEAHPQPRPQSRTRAKRQNGVPTSAAPTSNDLIGTATKLGCDYQRGTPIGDSKFIGLCNICWQWRKLPDKYFPSYLNEVSCDSKDDQCLAGWGKCRPVLRSVNVLINHGTKDNPEWQQESIFTVAACECQVEIGSPLHTFVAR